MKKILDHFSKLRPELVFLCLALLFGSLFLAITPPFQVPDEPNHFYRAWQVSEGGFISVKKDGRVGGELPASLEKLPQAFFYMPWSPKEKMSKIPMKLLSEIPLDPAVRKFYDFNNTAMYSPVCYLPAALGISVSRLLHAPPLYAFYAARFATLLCWIFLIYYAIRLIPVGKWLFLFLALLPMSLFINMSISADVMTNAFCFLFIAQVLNWAYLKPTFTNKELLHALLLAFLLSSVKQVYAPLILLFLLIPKTAIGTRKQWGSKIALLLFAGLVFSAFWSLLLNPLYITYQDYSPEFRNSAALVNGASMPEQIHYILHHGNYMYEVLFRSLSASFDMYFNGYIGMFGWLEKSFSLPFVISVYVLIFLLALLSGNSNIYIPAWHKLIFIIIFFLVLGLVFLSQHLIWDLVGSAVILNIQGRYLIPFMPLLFLLFYNRPLGNRKLIAPLALLCTAASLCYSVYLLCERYY